MVEVWLFTQRLLVLSSGGSVVLLLLALSSATYLAMTIAPALGSSADASAGRTFRAVGVASTAAGLLLALGGVRVGPPGSGGEVLPSLAVSVAAAAALGATVALIALTTSAWRARAGARGRARRDALQKARTKEHRRLEASRKAFLGGEDLQAEVRGREESLDRLRAAVQKLARTEATVEGEIAALGDGPENAELHAALRQTRDELRTKAELGRRIEEEAARAAYRVSCTAPLRLLLRRRPKNLWQDMRGDDASALGAKLEGARRELDRFLADAQAARARLAELASERPEPHDGDGDPWGQAMRDVSAVEEAFGRVRERLAIVAVRASARADMEALASAAGEVSSGPRSTGVPPDDLAALIDEVSRADAALSQATHADAEGRDLEETLTRSAAALRGEEDASLEDLLRALRDVA